MKKIFKMIATDMDGTLLKYHHEITPRTKRALLEAKKQGITIVVATGRPFQTVKKYIAEHPYIDFFVVNNGAAIYDTKKKGYIIEHAFKSQEVKDILEFAKTYTPHYEVHSEHAIYVHGHLRETFFKAMSKKLIGYEPIILPLSDVSIFDQVNATKILLIEEDQIKYDKLKSATKALGNYEVIQSQVAYIDINLENISKGQAITELANTLKMNLEDVIAFGDQENDLSMLQVSGFGVAMENAVPLVKKNADHITNSADNEGVAKTIEEFVLF
ncbi:MAG: Cof-type HAD-IIB family hydrolase [Acholeplasmataceae bacterium]